MKEKIKKLLRFITNPRLFLCFTGAWMITNGWSYLLFIVGTYFDINWLTSVSGAYLAFIWLPFTPEKLLTFIIAIYFLRFFFPDDEKTLAVLKNMHLAFKNKLMLKRKAKKRKNRNNKNN